MSGGLECSKQSAACSLHQARRWPRSVSPRPIQVCLAGRARRAALTELRLVLRRSLLCCFLGGDIEQQRVIVERCMRLLLDQALQYPAPAPVHDSSQPCLQQLPALSPPQQSKLAACCPAPTTATTNPPATLLELTAHPLVAAGAQSNRGLAGKRPGFGGSLPPRNIDDGSDAARKAPCAARMAGQQ